MESERENRIEVVRLSSEMLCWKSDLEKVFCEGFPNAFSIVGFYGNQKNCLEALDEYFGNCRIQIGDEPCLILAVDKVCAIGALVYSAGSTDVFTHRPFCILSDAGFYIRLIARMCESVVACFSRSIIGSWYLSEETLVMNPFMTKQKDYFLKSKPKFLKTTTKVEEEFQKYIGNPVFDIFYSAVIDQKTNLKCKQLYYFTKESAHLECVERYYQNLRNLPNIVKFGRNFSENQQNVLKTSYNPSNFALQLYKLLPVKIAKVSPFFPCFSSPNALTSICKETKASNLIESLINYISFHYFEQIVKNIPDVFVVSIYGPSMKNNSIVARNLFGIDSEYFEQAFICMQMQKVNDRNVLVFILKLVEDKLSNDQRQCITFLNAISDYVILNLKPYKMKFARNLLTTIVYCDNLINDPFLYKYELNLMVYPVDRNFELASARKDLPCLYRNLTFSALISEDNNLFEAEKLLVLNEIFENKGKWAVPVLCRSIKAILSQIYAQDTHPLNYWDKLSDFEIIQESQACCSQSGVCDNNVEIEMIRNEIKFTLKDVKLLDKHQVFEGFKHSCDDRCPWCQGLCELEYGHIGYHSLKMHRIENNKCCAVEFYNSAIFERIDGTKTESKANEVCEEWHTKLWETPWESVFGLNKPFVNSKVEIEPKMDFQTSIPIDSQNKCLTF